MKQKTKNFLCEAHLYPKKEESEVRFLGFMISVFVGIWLPKMNNADVVSIGGAYLLYSLPILIDALFVKKESVVGIVWRKIFVVSSAGILVISVIFIFYGAFKLEVPEIIRNVCTDLIWAHAILLFFEFIVHGCFDGMRKKLHDEDAASDHQHAEAASKDEVRRAVEASASMAKETLKKMKEGEDPNGQEGSST